jgi:hypothetical protein
MISDMTTKHELRRMKSMMAALCSDRGSTYLCMRGALMVNSKYTKIAFELYENMPP